MNTGSCFVSKGRLCQYMGHANQCSTTCWFLHSMIILTCVALGCYMCYRKIQEIVYFIICNSLKVFAYPLSSAFMVDCVNKNENKHKDLQKWHEPTCVYHQVWGWYVTIWLSRLMMIQPPNLLIAFKTHRSWNWKTASNNIIALLVSFLLQFGIGVTIIQLLLY